MQFTGSLIKEKGTIFLIVVVRNSIIKNNTKRNEIREFISKCPDFKGIPIILMAQNSKKIPVYQGRNDIVNFLSKLNLNQIPWKTYKIS